MPADPPESAETATRRLYAGWTRGVVRHAWTVIVLAALTSAFAAWYAAGHLDIDTSTTDMIAADTPFRRNAIAYDQAFPHFSNLIVAVIRSPTADAATAMASALTARLDGHPDLFEGVEYMADHPFFKRNGLLYLDIDALTELSDRLAAAEPLLATLAHEPNIAGLFEFADLALREAGHGADPDELGTLFARIADTVEAQAEGRPATLAWRDLIDIAGESSNQQIVIVRPDLSRGGFSPGAEALAAIRGVATDLRDSRFPETTARLTGSVALEDEELRSVALGGEKAGLLTLALVITLLVVGLRSFRLIIPAVVTLAIGLIWTAAFAALTVGHLNLISVAFAVLFIGLGVDFSIHYCLCFREYAGTDAARTLAATGAAVGGALGIGALCAAAGFLSFLPTDYKGLAELGLISGGGMAIAFFLNMTLLPAILAVFPGGTGGTPPAGTSATPFAHRRHRPILLAAAAAGIAAAAVSPFAYFDFNPMNLKDPTAESVAVFHDLASDPRNGVYAVDVLAADLDQAKREAQRLQALPEVGSAVTLHSLVPDNQDEKLPVVEQMSYFLAPALAVGPQTDYDTDDALAAIRDFRKTAASHRRANPERYLSAAASRLDHALSALDLEDSGTLRDMNRRLAGGLPGLLDALRLALEAAPVGIDDIPPEIRRNWVAADGRARVQLQPPAPMTSNAALQRFAVAVLDAAPAAVGTPVTISEAGNAVVSAFVEASLIAFGLVAGLLAILLRSAAGMMLVLIPVVLAAILTGGTAAVLDLPFNFANIIVLPLLFGLGVASGVHMVMRGRHPARTVDVMRTSTPRAVLFSAMTTIASFGSLALSGHLGMMSMGRLLTIAIGYMLVCMLLVLPALMAWVDRKAA